VQERQGGLSPEESEQFLVAQIGKLVTIYTSYPHQIGMGANPTSMGGAVHGHLEAIFPDAVVVELIMREQPTGPRVLIYKRAIIAVETRAPRPTP